MTAPYRLQMFSGLGIGINDAMEMQRQWNVTLSLIFEQIRSSALPGWAYDKDAIQPDDVRLLGQPQNSVPVSTMGREITTSLETISLSNATGAGSLAYPLVHRNGREYADNSGRARPMKACRMDSKTTAGAELMNQASNQHNAPEYRAQR